MMKLVLVLLAVVSTLVAAPVNHYHDSCIPKNASQTVQASENPGRTHKLNDLGYTDVVSMNEIWKQKIQTEKRCLQNWEDNWGFLTTFDAKGNTKEKQPLPEASNMFSNSVPNTNSGNYGGRLTSELGRSITSLESKFFPGNRRRQLSSEMSCY